MPNKTGLTAGFRVRGAQRHYRLYQWNGRDRMFVNDGGAIRDAGVRSWRVPIINTVLTTNVVTVTTAVAHRLASNATVYIETVDDSATYNGSYVVTVTSSTAFTYARTASNVSTANNGGWVTVQPTVATTGTGNLTGRYRWIAAPIIKNHTISRGRYVSGPPTHLSSELVCAGTQAAISGIPATHPDSAVTHWQIFRNQNGNYDSLLEDEVQDFWLVGTVAIGTTTFTDNVADKDLPPIACEFNSGPPPAFDVGFVYGGRLYGCGFTPYTTGTATVNSNTCLVDFSGSTLPAGFRGARFLKDGDTQSYEIVEVVSTSQICLDRPFSGAMSGATFSIYQDASALWYSEYDNFDSFGSVGTPNRLIVGGPGADEACVHGTTLNGYGYVFTKKNIYRVYGKGPANVDVKIGPDPVVAGIGAVGADAVWREGAVLYFTSYKGFHSFDGEVAPVDLGAGKLRQDLVKSTLNPDALSVCCVMSDGVVVGFYCPRTGQTENDVGYVYDLSTKTWWPELYVHPRFGWRDLDSNGDDALFYAQGKRIFQYGVGTNDGVASGTVTGTLTATTTTTATDSTASFLTTGGGLEEIYVHFFNPTTNALKGSRRITSNTATALTWSSSGAGGGTLTLAIGDRYHVGPVYWHWETKRTQIPNAVKRDMELDTRWELQGEGTASMVHRIDIVDESQDSNATPITINRTAIPLTSNRRNVSFAVRLEGRNTNADVVLSSISVKQDKPEPTR